MYREDSAPQRNVIVLGLRGRVIGKDRTTGATVWEHPTGVDHDVDLALTEDRVFAASGRAVFAIEYPSGRLLGRAPLPGTQSLGGRCTLLVDGNQLFVGIVGEITCFDLNGQLLWHDPLAGKGIGSVALGFPGNVRQADRG